MSDHDKLTDEQLDELERLRQAMYNADGGFAYARDSYEDALDDAVPALIAELRELRKREKQIGCLGCWTTFPATDEGRKSLAKHVLDDTCPNHPVKQITEYFLGQLAGTVAVYIEELERETEKLRRLREEVEPVLQSLDKWQAERQLPKRVDAMSSVEYDIFLVASEWCGAVQYFQTKARYILTRHFGKERG